MTTAIFHVAIDGMASAAQVGLAEGVNTQMLPINYGQEPNWKRLQLGEKVYLLDFSFSPEIMARLKKDYNLIWIDHHADRNDEIEKVIGKDTPGIRFEGLSSALLTWNYFNPKKKKPKAIELISDYDLGDYLKEDTIPLQRALWNMDIFPIGLGKLDIWNRIINDKVYLNELINRGKEIYELEKVSFEAKCRYMVDEVDFHGLKGLCANFAIGDIFPFESVIDFDNHDVVIGYYRYVKRVGDAITRHWKFSIRSISNMPPFHLGQLCQQHHAGDGDKRSAGFSVQSLYDVSWLDSGTPIAIPEETTIVDAKLVSEKNGVKVYEF